MAKNTRARILINLAKAQCQKNIPKAKEILGSLVDGSLNDVGSEKDIQVQSVTNLPCVRLENEKLAFSSKFNTLSFDQFKHTDINICHTSDPTAHSEQSPSLETVFHSRLYSSLYEQLYVDLYKHLYSSLK